MRQSRRQPHESRRAAGFEGHVHRLRDVDNGCPGFGFGRRALHHGHHHVGTARRLDDACIVPQLRQLARLVRQPDVQRQRHGQTIVVLLATEQVEHALTGGGVDSFAAGDRFEHVRDVTWRGERGLVGERAVVEPE